MARARYRGAEHQIVTFTEHAELVLRSPRGDVLVLAEADREEVEVQCERCGRWSTSPALAETGRWVCAHRTCFGHEESSPRARREASGALRTPCDALPKLPGRGSVHDRLASRLASHLPSRQRALAGSIDRIHR